MLIPGGIFYALEGWTYSQGVYFTVVTLTTVGFGYFVPAQVPDGRSASVTALYSITISLWLWIGLALVAALLSEIQSVFKYLSIQCHTRPCFKLRKRAETLSCRREEEEEEGGSKDPSPSVNNISPSRKKRKEIEATELQDVENGSKDHSPPSSADNKSPSSHSTKLEELELQDIEGGSKDSSTKMSSSVCSMKEKGTDHEEIELQDVET